MRVKLDEYHEIVKIDDLFFLGTSSHYPEEGKDFNTASKEYVINTLLNYNWSEKDIIDFINSEDKSQTEKIEENNIDLDKITYSFIKTSMDSKSLSIILNRNTMIPEVCEETPDQYFQIDIMYYKDSNLNKYFIIYPDYYYYHTEKVFTSLSEFTKMIRTIFSAMLSHSVDYIERYDIKHLSKKITEKIEGK